MNSGTCEIVKLIKKDFFTLMVDENDTVSPTDLWEAHKVLKKLGYKKIKEGIEYGNPIEIWKNPESEQTK